MRTKKWWGWGFEDKSFSLEKRNDFLPFVEQKLSIKISSNNQKLPINISDISLPKIQITKKIINEIESIVGDKNVKTDNYSRLIHTYGKSYQDLIRIRSGEVTFSPDVIVYPNTNDEVESILKLANENDIKVIPFGGGTSVVGGIEVKEKGKYICLDLSKRMNRLIKLDKESMLATFQAGIYGPTLENLLQEEKYTLSHYPQSFEFSTLGGWVAARSAGQQSTKYGKIEKLVSALKMITPTGNIITKSIPAKASGSDINQIIVGSEGIYGVITEVTVKIHPIPEKKDYQAYLFQSFDQGISFIKELIHKNDIYPATVRLSDESETKMLLKLSEKHGSFLKDKISSLVRTYMKDIKGFNFDNISFLLLGFEGNKDKVNFDLDKVEKVLESFKVIKLGNKAGDSWYKTRFDLPYLRDNLLDYDIAVDTLETCTNWQNLNNLYCSTKDSLISGIHSLNKKGLVACHISHIYHEGASLYYTFAYPHSKDSNKLSEWKNIKDNVTKVISENDGAISHHHGIGADHSNWLSGEIGNKGIEIIASIKNNLDPKNIMNPNKIIS